MTHVRLLVSLAALFASSAVVIAVPSAPTNLLTSVSGSTIVISWLAPPGPIQGFYLVAGLTPGGTVAANVLAPNPSSSLNGFTAFPIPPGTYYFRVHAFDVSGISAPSNESIAVVTDSGGGCAGPPLPPTGLAATVTGLMVSINFAAGGGCPAQNYALHAGSAPGLSNITIANLGSATGISTLAPPGIYYVRVFAQNTAGTSAPSNEIVVRVGVGDSLFRR